MTIYLDIDGVMIPDRFPAGAAISPAFSARLRQILNATGAQLVVSSQRRRSTDVLSLLAAAGFTSADLAADWRTPLQIIDADDDLSLRGQEIAAHSARAGVHDFVILDDCPVLASQADRHVQTDPAVGLTDADVGKAISILQGQHSQSQAA
jgi:hypothetical protein